MEAPGRVLQRQLPVLRPQDRAGRATTAGASCCQEFLGGGQDAATNDSIRVANEIGAFADITGLTQPYADALTRNEVVAVGRALHVPRVVRRSAGPTPGASSPTARSLAESSAEYANKRLLGRHGRLRRRRPRGRAAHDGGHRPQQPRVPAVRRHVRGADLAAEGNEVDAAARLHARPRHAPDPGGQPPGQAQGRRASRRCPAPATPSCRCTWPQEATAQGYDPEWLVGRRRLHRHRPRAARSSPTTRPTSGTGPSAAAARRHRPAARDRARPTPPTARCATTSRPSWWTDLSPPAATAGPRRPDGRART